MKQTFSIHLKMSEKIKVPEVQSRLKLDHLFKQDESRYEVYRNTHNTLESITSTSGALYAASRPVIKARPILLALFRKHVNRLIYQLNDYLINLTRSSATYSDMFMNN